MSDSKPLISKKLKYADSEEYGFDEFVSQSCFHFGSEQKQPPVSSVGLSEKHLTDIRDDFYLKIIDRSDARLLIIGRFRQIIDSMIQSKQFTKYDWEKDGPINVFKNGEKLQQIIAPIITYGSSSWNDIVVGSTSMGISRVNGIIAFVKNQSGELTMMVLDAWSLSGSIIKTSNNKMSIKVRSKDKDRRLLLAKLTDHVSLVMVTGSYTFSQDKSKTCVICMDNPRDDDRFNCGHRVACKQCTKKLSVCPICQESICRPHHDAHLNKNVIETSGCFDTYLKK
jgi:hypothetical protein